ncbi:MAG: hypothetical protein RL715_31, partial [Chloroflexota bacterium]
LTETHRLVVLPLRAAHHEDEEATDKEDWKEGAQEEADELT